MTNALSNSSIVSFNANVLHTPKKEELSEPSLETEFEDLVFCREVDINQRAFADYFDPNEYHPENIQPHLQRADPGYSVSTGTERGNFLLLLSDPAKCKGLVKRDINTRVKAFDDFNILLFKLCESVDDYCRLSGSFDGKVSRAEFFKARVELIKERMRHYSFKNEKQESYYYKNLTAFAGIYFCGGEWKNGNNVEFSAVNYHLNPEQYEKIRKYAISGNIISTTGSINDLMFLKNRKITVVDTSNIRDYSLINLQGAGSFSPIIIWTVGTGSSGTDYYSVHYNEILTEKEKREFDGLVETLRQSQTLENNLAMSLNNLISLLGGCDFHYTQKSLKALRDYVAEHIIQDDLVGPIDTSKICFSRKLESLSLDQINHLVKNPQLTVPKLNSTLRKWVSLTAHQYLSFCQIEGWQNAFKSNFAERYQNLPGFLEKLREAGLEETFRNRFGREEFAKFESDLSKF